MTRFKTIKPGKRIGMLTVIGPAEPVKSGKQRASTSLCRCDCGVEKVVRNNSLNSQKTQSCGCHNGKRHQNGSLYSTWTQMIQRCYNPKNKKYPLYGGRGIKVCKQWHNFENYEKDIRKLGPCPGDGYHLDRIDNDLGYAPDNMRWVSPRQNNNNRRSSNKYRGVHKYKNKWQSRIQLNDKRLHLGCFHCRQLAAYYYDIFAECFDGTSEGLNFPSIPLDKKVEIALRFGPFVEADHTPKRKGSSD